MPLRLQQFYNFAFYKNISVSFFRFAKSKYFFYQISIAIVVSIILVWLLLISLGWMTDHGQAISVPPVKGLQLSKARLLAEDRGLEIEIMDSTFVLNTKPGTILEQDPKPKTPVKPGRKIYVSIQVFSPPFIKMPNVKDASLRQALSILKTNGLNLGKVTYKPDYASNAVLYAEVNNKQMDEGMKVRKGSYVDLVIANGLGADEISVPDLSGNSLEEIKIILQENHLQLGVILFDSKISDSTLAMVFRQSPDVYDELGNANSIHLGQSIDVWLTNDDTKIKSDSLRSLNKKEVGSQLDLNQ